MAQIIVVTSGKGGVGKSSVCAFLGEALSQRGKKVLLLEMDSGLRGLDIMLGVEDQTVYDLSDVLTGRCEPIKAIATCPFAEHLHLISAPFDSGFLPDSGDLARLTKGLAHHYDFVFVDTPAGLGQNLEVCLRVAHRGLVVVTPDPVCIRDGARVADLMWQRGMTDLRLLINKVGVKTPRDSRIIPDLDQVIDGVGAQLIGVIPYEEQVPRVLSQGKRLEPGLLATKVFDNIAQRLSGNYAELALE